MRNFLLKSVIIGLGLAQSDETLQACGDAFFLPSKVIDLFQFSSDQQLLCEVALNFEC